MSSRCAPEAAHHLDGVAFGFELAEPVEDPPSAHAGDRDEVADGYAFGWCGGQCTSEDRVRVVLLVCGGWLACAGITWPAGSVIGARLTKGLRRWQQGPCG
jgi:hypothetical protein